MSSLKIFSLSVPQKDPKMNSLLIGVVIELLHVNTIVSPDIFGGDLCIENSCLIKNVSRNTDFIKFRREQYENIKRNILFSEMDDSQRNLMINYSNDIIDIATIAEYAKACEITSPWPENLFSTDSVLVLGLVAIVKVPVEALGFFSFEALSMRDMDLEDVEGVQGLINIPNLKYLDLEHNNLSSLIDFSKFSNLQIILLGSNPIRIRDAYDIKGNSKLKHVDLSNIDGVERYGVRLTRVFGSNVKFYNQISFSNRLLNIERCTYEKNRLEYRKLIHKPIRQETDKSTPFISMIISDTESNQHLLEFRNAYYHAFANNITEGMTSWALGPGMVSYMCNSSPLLENFIDLAIIDYYKRSYLTFWENFAKFFAAEYNLDLVDEMLDDIAFIDFTANKIMCLDNVQLGHLDLAALGYFNIRKLYIMNIGIKDGIENLERLSDLTHLYAEYNKLERFPYLGNFRSLECVSFKGNPMRVNIRENSDYPRKIRIGQFGSKIDPEERQVKRLEDLFERIYFDDNYDFLVY